jgi:hypothetical protein
VWFQTSVWSRFEESRLAGIPESAAQAESYRVFDKRLNVPVVR